MPPPAADDVLDREFLVVRAKLIEVAAALDRVDRADGSVADDARMKTIHQAIETLNRDTPDRAEQIQLLFSLAYDHGWRDKFGLLARD